MHTIDDILVRHTKDMLMLRNPDFRGHCDGCEEPILSTPGITYNSPTGLLRRYHPACFKCHFCAANLAPSSTTAAPNPPASAPAPAPANPLLEFVECDPALVAARARATSTTATTTTTTTSATAAAEATTKPAPRSSSSSSSSALACLPCYRARILGACAACDGVLCEGGFVRCAGRLFHRECVKCKQCGEQLQGSYFEKDGGFWCKARKRGKNKKKTGVALTTPLSPSPSPQTCYREKFIPVCGKCATKILPDAKAGSITSIEWKGVRFHQDCFGCADCQKPFVDLKALQYEGNLYCKDCHSIRVRIKQACV
ncbi:hypothetical protein DFJ73DRAFT_798322 [Zopfochytrium polystomum]|nr:hypothetical protein DFJ73DRAFT_798322 [Zopfochytrium polystomum]